jgi:hypothetical protein
MINQSGLLPPFKSVGPQRKASNPPARPHGGRPGWRAGAGALGGSKQQIGPGFGPGAARSHCLKDSPPPAEVRQSWRVGGGGLGPALGRVVAVPAAPTTVGLPKRERLCGGLRG